MTAKVTGETFWVSVEKGPKCWLWIGPTSVKGQAIGTLNGERLSARRIAYYLTTGEIPEGRLGAICKDQACVNPAHAKLMAH